MSVEIKVAIGLTLVSLAGAAIFYITFLIAVDEVRKDMAGGSEEVLVIIMAILIIVGMLGICFVDAIDGIKKHKKYVRNKYNKEG